MCGFLRHLAEAFSRLLAETGLIDNPNFRIYYASPYFPRRKSSEVVASCLYAGLGEPVLVVLFFVAELQGAVKVLEDESFEHG